MEADNRLDYFRSELMGQIAKESKVAGEAAHGLSIRIAELEKRCDELTRTLAHLKLSRG